MKLEAAAATILEMTHPLLESKEVKASENALEAISIIRDAVYCLANELNITHEMWDSLGENQDVLHI